MRIPPPLTTMLRTTLEAAATRAENLPVTPSRAAEWAIRRHHDRRRRIASADPTWAAIEERRSTGRGTKVFLSSDAGLGFPEWETQRSIEARLFPDPAWMPLAQRARHWQLARVAAELRHRTQRLRRGWSNHDVFNAGAHLATTTAEMLEHLAEVAYGWPRSDEHPTMEDWTAALRDNAALLRRWVHDPAVEQLRSRWYRAASDPDRDDTEELFAELGELEASNLEGARTAMRWVAENIEALWD